MLLINCGVSRLTRLLYNRVVLNSGYRVKRRGAGIMTQPIHLTMQKR